MPIIIPRLADPGDASVDERHDHLMLLEAARQALDVEWTATLATAVASGDHEVLGYPNMVACLTATMRIAASRAHRYVKNAMATLRNPATFSAWVHRQITSDQVEMLFRVAEKMPDRYPAAESILLEVVGDSAEETKRVLDYWQAESELGADLEIEQQLERRRFEISRRPNGMVAGEFSLPRLEGETLLVAIDSLMPPPAADDGRTASQRRADALGDLARSFLEGSEPPTVGGERPHLAVHVDVDGLQNDGGRLHETEDGVVLDIASIRQLACDASVYRVVFGSESEVLDLGRKARVVSAPLRRAVVARDRRCIVPGCGRSPRWCDVHHIVFWADGGETGIDNLCLLCRYHHTLVHLELLDLTGFLTPVSALADRCS
jgi:hypothetical protein